MADGHLPLSQVVGAFKAINALIREQENGKWWDKVKRQIGGTRQRVHAIRANVVYKYLDDKEESEGY